MQHETPLAGTTALVTGGSRGIGCTIAAAMATAGAVTLLTYKEGQDAAEEVVASIDAMGGTAHALPLDLTDSTSIARLQETIEQDFPALSILVNNAGVNRPADLDEISLEDWDAVLDTNLKGVFFLTQALFPILKRQGASSIVNIGSVSGQYGGPRTAHYAASKAGLISLSHVFARFGAAHGVRSNTLAAGLIASDMAQAAMESDAVKKAADGILLKRFGTADEVAATAVFLASAQADYVTGQTINVNGGLHLS
ncbi:MAG: SDR family oxidoreductase [Pseudomonadota bacterium]